MLKYLPQSFNFREMLIKNIPLHKKEYYDLY